jgi:hypothetical protein
MTERTGGRECDVRDCAERATVVWTEPGDGLVMQAAVCGFHQQALDAGEPFARDDREIIMGRNLPPEVFSFVSHHGVHGNHFDLVIGWDGVEEQRLRVRISKDLLAEMRDWA